MVHGGGASPPPLPLSNCGSLMGACCRQFAISSCSTRRTKRMTGGCTGVWCRSARSAYYPVRQSSGFST